MTLQHDTQPAATRLRRQVNTLGVLAALAYAGLTVLSYVQAPALWALEDAPRTKAWFEALATGLQPHFPPARAWLADNELFAGPYAIILSYWLPLAAVSAAVLGLALALTCRGEHADEALVRLVHRWALAFVAIAAFGYPVFTQDFWLSAAWGRMIAAGVNPYYGLFTPEALAGLPLDHFPMPMSYGPLWGLVSGAVMLLAGGSTLAAALLFKGVLAAAWIGALHLVARITADQPPRERSIALAVFGWAPAGVSQSLAEGHNDIAMVALALAWVALLQHGRREAPVALAASALCKYATVPLLIVDAIHALRHARTSWSGYVRRMVVPGLLAITVTAIFYRNPQFFDGLKLVGDWRFLRPADVVAAIEAVLGISLLPASIAVSAVFPLAAVHAIRTAWGEPEFRHLLRAALAVMATVLFTAANHVWPWYLVWGLGLAALVPSWWLSRFVVGVAMLAPFTLASWWVEPFAHHREMAALAMYCGAIVWMVMTRPRAAAASGERAAMRPHGLHGSETRHA